MNHLNIKKQFHVIMVVASSVSEAWILFDGQSIYLWTSQLGKRFGWLMGSSINKSIREKTESIRRDLISPFLGGYNSPSSVSGLFS